MVEVFLQGRVRVLCYLERLCVPYFDGLRSLVLEEAQNSSHSIHPNSTNIDRD